MNRLLRRGGIVLSALTVTAGASAGLGGPVSASLRSAASGSSAAGATDTPAARLYAALDQLLREHVDLTATVVETAVTSGATSPQTKAAEQVLGQNTDALGAAIGSIYGAAARAEFLKLWRAHIGYFVDFTLGKATHNQAMVQAAQKGLAGYVSAFAQFMSTATKLPRSALEADLRGHVTTLERAIDAIVAKSPAAGEDIQMAAMHMDGTAQVLTEGIVASKPAIKGQVNSKAADLRAALTGLLIQHVADTGFVVETAIAAKGNLKSPEVMGAVHALALNTDALGNAFGSLYGPTAKAEFLRMWRAHIGFFVNYTLGVATRRSSMVALAQRDLTGYVASFSHFVAGATTLPASAVAADLRGHISTLETAINAIVANKPAAAQDLVMAETHMAGTAAVLSAGIVASMPAKFGS